MNDTKYNGWTNYATWRVNLEMFDAINPHYQFGGAAWNDEYDLGLLLKDYAEDYIIDTSAEGSLAQEWAIAFIANVNWTEIASHLIDAYAEE